MSREGDRKRELVDAMCSDWRVSIRKVCGALRFDLSTYHYESLRTDPAALKKRIKEISETRVRYGYRRVHFMHDQLATGRKLPVLTVIDTFSRYVPVLDVKFNYRGEDVGKSL